MPGRVFVTGGSGFVGSAVLSELVRRNFAVNALSHNRDLRGHGDAVRTITGDLFDDRALDEGMRGCDAVVHLVGIIMEKRSKGVTFERVHHQGTVRVVRAAERNGIKRYVHMSALGARANAVSEYHKTKYLAEEDVRASSLEWTIFRPSLIHGPKGEFMQMESKWVRKSAPPFLFMPYFGAGLLGLGGAGTLQPVFVNDVARAFVEALENRRTIGEVYPLVGAQRVTWPRMHDIASRAIANKPATNVQHWWQLPMFPIGALAGRNYAAAMPVSVAKFYAAIGIAPLLGFNRDQVVMSQEDNTADITKVERDFGWTPAAFEASLNGYASQL